MCSKSNSRSLGFCRMHDFNLSLIAKLGWKLLTNADCLWVQQLQKKYIKYENFIYSPNPSSTSWLWRGIQKTKSFISVGACLKVSRKTSSFIWDTNRVPSLPSFKPFPKFPSNRNFQALQIRDLIDPILSRWKASAIFSLFDSNFSQEILKTRISPESDSTYLWTPSSSGQFSLSSAYKYISTSCSNNFYSTIPQFWQALWKLNINDRLKLFLWKIAWNILPTKSD